MNHRHPGCGKHGTTRRPLDTHSNGQARSLGAAENLAQVATRDSNRNGKHRLLGVGGLKKGKKI